MIKSLAMPMTTIGENPLQFPLPATDGLGTVTVLCGPDGSGKSFILRMLSNLLSGKGASDFNKGHGWNLNLTEPTAASHRPHHHTAQMTSIGTLSNSRAGKEPTENDTHLKIQIAIFGALIDALGQPAYFDLQSWLAEPPYRQAIIAALGPSDEERVYWLDGDVPEFARLFEEVFACRLGFRQAKAGLEIVLGWSNNITAPYASWSDGQKSFLTVLATTYALRPDVYIFDEVENFLHPQLISKTIDYLKRNCRQTVLSSHHPHVIFGRAIDAVFYVETLPASRPVYAQLALKYQRQPTAPRRIERLESDAAKLASAYRLFDISDAALLASAGNVRDSVDLHLNHAVLHHFECAAISAKASVYMDRQTEEIGDFVASFAPQPRVILDWGAGLGRSLAELSKRPVRGVEDPFSWILYEPDPAAQTGLASRVASLGVPVKIVRERTGLSGVAAGLILLTNVLHVLDPTRWSDAIADAWETIARADHGVILVTEIYPLLAAERFAIPIPPDWLSELFTDLGFKVALRHFATHGSQSYCLAVHTPSRAQPSRAELLAVIVGKWRELASYYLSTYEGLGRVSSLADQRDLLNAAFGLARVTSCLAALDADCHGRDATPDRPN